MSITHQYLISVGCMAAGVKAYGWLSALGWETAQDGSFAIARIAAEGPVAFAPHANYLIARQILRDAPPGSCGDQP